MAYTRLLEAKIDWSDDKLESNTDIAYNTRRKNVDVVLNVIGGELVHDLQKHINDDFYKQYQPKSYPRRKDHPIFGTALDSEKNFDTNVKNGVLEFYYTPLGFHTGKLRDTLDFDEDRYSPSEWNRPIKPKPIHGDKLINRLEKGEFYDWAPHHFPERPFWTNFVNEENNGKLISHFNTAVRNTDMTDGAFTYRYSGATYRDLSFGGADIMSDSAEWSADFDDLPF